MTLRPPKLPSMQEPFWKLERTACMMMTEDPPCLWMHVVVFFQQQGVFNVICNKPYRMKLEAEEFRATLRLYDGDSGLCIVEMQRREGCSLAFHAAWGKLIKSFAQPLD